MKARLRLNSYDLLGGKVIKYRQENAQPDPDAE
jgi:hypothetical protein